MKNIFTNHPHSVGESYFQHFFFALSFACKMLAAGVVCLIHAVFPFLFEKTGSNILMSIIHEVLQRLPKNDPRVIALSKLFEKNTTYSSPSKALK